VRVTFLTIMPSPYTLDLFAAIAADGKIAPHVLYMEMAAPDTYWGSVPVPEYSEILKGGWRSLGGGRIHWNPGVAGAIRRSRPDLVVVAGYSSLTAQVAMRWLHWNRIPWIFWGEVPGMRRLGLAGRVLRRVAQYPAVHWPDAIAAIGTVAASEYRRLARPDCNVFNIPYHTDLTQFLDQPRRTSSGKVRILYCGQLIERKGVGILLEAFLALADEFPELDLVLVGEGPLRQTLVERVPARLRDRVEFAGFQSVDQLPGFFSTADIFVLPSLHDGWGVVVNQALAAGLPIICSSSVGAATDLVNPGHNGFIVPPADAAALAAAIRDLASNCERRTAFGENSRARALDWTSARGVDRWVELAERVLERSSTSNRIVGASK
jgi:glycosyltransferase involved in cell wall biosynthesis